MDHELAESKYFHEEERNIFMRRGELFWKRGGQEEENADLMTNISQWRIRPTKSYERNIAMNRDVSL